MTSNDTRIIVAISTIIIYGGLSSNLSLKLRFKKVLYLARNISKWYQPPYRNLITKDILYVMQNQNMERKLILIKKELHIYGLLFLGDGATISRTPLLKKLVSGKYSSSCIRAY